mgnify:FL=1
MAAVLQDEKSTEMDISLDEANHLTDVMNNLDAPQSEQKAKIVMVMVKVCKLADKGFFLNF